MARRTDPTPIEDVTPAGDTTGMELVPTGSQLPLQYNEEGELVVQPDSTVSLHLVHTVSGTEGVDFARFLTPEEKRRLGESGKGFYITKVFATMHQEYGEGRGFECDMEGFRFSFVMGYKPQVQGEYDTIEQITASGGKVGPVRLELIEWKGGLPFYKIVPAEYSPDVELLPF